MEGPQSYITYINQEINELALNSSILYWLTNEEKYAKFAADILEQWAKGVYYQDAIIGACRTGLLDMQNLDDYRHRSIILVYDFVKPFMKDKGYEMKYYEAVFDKFAASQVFKGFWNCNWYAVESSTLVFAALSLEDKKKQDYYLNFFLEKDTINGDCGHLSLKTTVKDWLTPDGHWKEPGFYHNYPVDNLLMASLAMEKNGYDIFRKYPSLFKTTFAMLKYSFPNLAISAFGDTRRIYQSAQSLEIGLLKAMQYNQPELPEMLSAMGKMIDEKVYDRKTSGYLGLLSFLPDIPKTNVNIQWPRTASLDFARYFLQRNGNDPNNSLMIGVQGASYNHSHSNGMAMELYGFGEVLGIDAGRGINYEHPLHVNYYKQYAAHNTVVAAGNSHNTGFIELAAMEPMPEEKAISQSLSFSDTRYFDKSTGTKQSRVLGIVRTSENSGYYVHIFRSDNKISNDYIYHNIGDSVVFYNDKKEPLKSFSATYPLKDKDRPGFRYFTDVKKLPSCKNNITAKFFIKDKDGSPYFLQALINGDEKNNYFQAFSPITQTAGTIYNNKQLPLFTIRKEAEAELSPFVVIYEPYRPENENIVECISVEKRNDGNLFTALTVFCKDGSHHQIFQSVDTKKTFTSATSSFSGYYGIAAFNNKKLSSIYLGKGNEIIVGGYSLKSKTNDGAASLNLHEGGIKISCNQPTEIGFPAIGKVKKITLKQGSTSKELKFVINNNRIYVNVPAIENGQVLTEK